MSRLSNDSPAVAVAAALDSENPRAHRAGEASNVVRLPSRGARSIETLGQYIEAIGNITGAQTVSLLVDPADLPGFDPLFLTIGDAQAIPGFESQKAALELTAELHRGGHGASVPASDEAVRYYPGVADGTHFFRFCVSRAVTKTTGLSGTSFPVERRRNVVATPVSRPEGVAWIGLSFGKGNVCQPVDGSPDRCESQRKELPAAPDWLWRLIIAGARMAWQVYELATMHRDSITGLAQRSELQVQLEHSLAAARDGHEPFALALVNPDEFEQVNQRLGRVQGDAALREIGTILQQSIRLPDTVYHYGGAVFATLFRVTSQAEASQAAERLRKDLCGHALLERKIRLDFSVGAVFCGTHSQLDHLETLRRADSALNAAKRSGGAQTMTWASEGLAKSSGSNDRLSGIFTADTRKDYRNMLLLWETVQVISSQTDTAVIAKEFISQVNRTFKPSHAALVSVGDKASSFLSAPTLTVVKQPFETVTDHVARLISKDQRHLLERAQRKQEAQSACVSAPDGDNGSKQALTAYAVPLPGGDIAAPRCLYVDGPANSFHLDSADLLFLSILSKQVAVALDRSELVAHLKNEKERESRRLRAEVRDLRQALRHSKLVYQSPRMEAVLQIVRKVAPTDATVLITGESGTGKEMVARFLHDQSQPGRRDAFVTLDCGAIAPSLIETELFGHAKGAYTGASGSSKGRIPEAEGGTLFLDEIGELPLDVQAKLLRFVQEREITPVGASRSLKIDARIVAATNRDLAAEVEAGRFRQDLYYRLRVVSVTIPPLRERPEDIIPLAQYFLDRFSAQYEKPDCCLSLEAQTALREHPWVGNVRELQNQLLQAVIMSGNEELSRADLHLVTEPGKENMAQGPKDASPNGAHATSSPPRRHAAIDTDRPVTSDDFGHRSGSGCEPWEYLRTTLAEQVEEAIRQHEEGTAHPLGSWLSEDLVVSAHDAYGRIGRKASEALGMAETTFRRQLEKINRAARAYSLPRSPHWTSVKPAIQGLVRSAAAKRDENLLLKARRLLLAEVIARIPENDLLGATLMGVTKPTYQRWKAGLQAS